MNMAANVNANVKFKCNFHWFVLYACGLLTVSLHVVCSHYLPQIVKQREIQKSFRKIFDSSAFLPNSDGSFYTIFNMHALLRCVVIWAWAPYIYIYPTFLTYEDFSKPRKSTRPKSHPSVFFIFPFFFGIFFLFPSLASLESFLSFLAGNKNIQHFLRINIK